MNKINTPKILIVDDEPDVIELVEYQLKNTGYQVESLREPINTLAKVSEYKPDLIILDIMMKGIDGLQVCRMLRADKQYSNTLILFLSARSEPEDRIKGLSIGADDYLCKPFDIRELVLRVDSLLRLARERKVEMDTSLQVGKVKLDFNRYEVLVNDHVVNITATEFRLLRLLMERKGRVQSRDNLLVNVWNYDSEIETRTVDTHIRRLRRKLGDQAHLIKTIRGIGYQLSDL